MINIEKLNENSTSDLIYMPTSYYKVVKNFIEDVENISEEIVKTIPSEQKDAIGAVILSGLNNASKGLLDGLRGLEDISKLMYNEKRLDPRYYKVNSSKLTGELTGDAFLTKLNTGLGLSNKLRCILYRSGFTVELDYIEEDAVIDLITNLASRNLELGKQTNSLIYSNESVIYAKVLLDFFYEHSVSCTLDVADWREFVMLEDINLIAMYVIKQFMPNGFTILRACENVVKGYDISEDSVKLNCDYAFTASVDPIELIKYNPKIMLSEKQKELLSRGVPKSITEKEVIEYQKTLELNQEQEFKIDENISMFLKHPRALEHIEQGEIWIESIEDAVDSILSDIEDNDEVRYKTKNDVLKTTILNKYCHFVSKFVINDGFSRNRNDIMTGLKRASSNNEVYKRIVEIFTDFIKTNVYTVIGINNYVCPNCEEKQKTHDDNVFKEVIPLNVYWSFFEVCTLKQKLMDQRTENI